MSQQLGVIVPYFGSLPSTFKSWAKSIRINPNVKYFLITDQRNIVDHSENLVVVNLSFKDLQIKLKEMLNVHLTSPYKLCDLKPSYGYVFSDLLNGFDYWGYSDLDLAFGNLDELLYEIKMFQHHKTFSKGHFSIYKNTPEINELFRIKKHNNYWNYVKNSKIIWVFDENYFGDIIGINGIILKEKKNLFDDVSLYSDVHPDQRGFFNINHDKKFNCFYYLSDLDLVEVSYDSSKKIFYEKPLVYVHYQKRKVKINELDDGSLMIYPFHWESIFSLEDGKKALIQNYNLDNQINKHKTYLNLKNKILKLLNLLIEIFNLSLIKILLFKILKMPSRLFRNWRKFLSIGGAI